MLLPLNFNTRTTEDKLHINLWTLHTHFNSLWAVMLIIARGFYNSLCPNGTTLLKSLRGYLYPKASKVITGHRTQLNKVPTLALLNAIIIDIDIRLSAWLRPLLPLDIEISVPCLDSDTVYTLGLWTLRAAWIKTICLVLDTRSLSVDHIWRRQHLTGTLQPATQTFIFLISWHWQFFIYLFVVYLEQKVYYIYSRHLSPMYRQLL